MSPSPANLESPWTDRTSRYSYKQRLHRCDARHIHHGQVGQPPKVPILAERSCVARAVRQGYSNIRPAACSRGENADARSARFRQATHSSTWQRPRADAVSRWDGQ
jgi:hypothetical protein